MSSGVPQGEAWGPLESSTALGPGTGQLRPGQQLDSILLLLSPAAIWDLAVTSQLALSPPQIISIAHPRQQIWKNVRPTGSCFLSNPQLPGGSAGASPHSLIWDPIWHMKAHGRLCCVPFCAVYVCVCMCVVYDGVHDCVCTCVCLHTFVSTHSISAY